MNAEIACRLLSLLIRGLISSYGTGPTSGSSAMLLLPTEGRDIVLLRLVVLLVQLILICLLQFHTPGVDRQ